MKRDLKHLSTVCYLRAEGEWLMLHRNKKAVDVNKGKYLGIGGHFRENETPHECACREIMEETGIKLSPDELVMTGFLTFVYNDNPADYIIVFVADLPEKPIIRGDCPEGTLRWVPENQLCELPLWTGDRIFLDRIREGTDFFSMALYYDNDDLLRYELR